MKIVEETEEDLEDEEDSGSGGRGEKDKEKLSSTELQDADELRSGTAVDEKGNQQPQAVARKDERAETGQSIVAELGTKDPVPPTEIRVRSIDDDIGPNANDDSAAPSKDPSFMSRYSDEDA